MLLAACLMPVGMTLRAGAQANSACPATPAKILGDPRLILPDDAKITATRLGFEIDVGSDGRVRGIHTIASSGDANVDLTARQLLQAASYQPAQTGCVAYSGGLIQNYHLSAGAADRPVPLPAALDRTCTPFITAFLTPHARDRKRTGTAIVAVGLDAAATLQTSPVLRKSAGSASLDNEALRMAAAGHYRFLQGSACTPQAFTESLEITFQ